MVSLFGIITLLLIALIVFGLGFSLFRKRRSSEGRFGGNDLPRAASGVLLNCPHCGQETEARGHVCRHCLKDL